MSVKYRSVQTISVHFAASVFSPRRQTRVRNSSWCTHAAFITVRFGSTLTRLEISLRVV